MPVWEVCVHYYAFTVPCTITNVLYSTVTFYTSMRMNGPKNSLRHFMWLRVTLTYSTVLLLFTHGPPQEIPSPFSVALSLYNIGQVLCVSLHPPLLSLFLKQPSPVSPQIYGKIPFQFSQHSFISFLFLQSPVFSPAVASVFVPLFF